MKIKVTLGIGLSGCYQTAILEIDDDDIAACETDDEREELFSEYAMQWANNYIDIGYEIKDE